MVLSFTVLAVSVTVPLLLRMPPPPLAALPETTVFIRCSAPLLYSPPPVC